MKIKIDEIVDIFNLYTKYSQYYKLEIMAKFEDAFLSVVRGYKTGIKLMHGQRSMIDHKGVKSELADMRFIFYSEKDGGSARVLYLFFKKGKFDKLHTLKTEISERHYKLYEECPEVVYKKTHMLTKALSHPKEGSIEAKAGAMFAIYHENAGACEISFSTVDNLTHVAGEEYELRHCGLPFKVEKGAAFEFCSYVDTLQTFLEQAKEMKMGKKIDFISLAKILADCPFDDMPEEIVAWIKDRNIGELHWNDGVSHTVFLNVDELE